MTVAGALNQGCGNTISDLSDLAPVHSIQVRNFYLLVLGQVKIKLTIQYFILILLIIMNSHVV